MWYTFPMEPLIYFLGVLVGLVYTPIAMMLRYREAMAEPAPAARARLAEGRHAVQEAQREHAFRAALYKGLVPGWFLAMFFMVMGAYYM